jgi:TolA-binding protein
MRYVHALALKEAGDYARAREEFRSLAERFPERAEAREALWRIAQCRLDPLMTQAEVWRKTLSNTSKSQAQAESLVTLNDVGKKLGAAAEETAQSAARMEASDPQSPILARMRHDEAWAWRVVGEIELESRRHNLRVEAAQKLLDQEPKEEKPAADGPKRPQKPRKARTLDAALASLPPSGIDVSSIPLQPGEKLAREKFRAAIDAAGESPLAGEARIELADLHAQRGELDPAIELLNEAVGAETEPDLADRLRIRLAGLYLDKGDLASAQSAARPVLETGGRSAYAGYARVILVEALYRQSQWEAVIEQAKEFADVGRFARIPGVSDHALLRMAQAQQKLEKWDDSRSTLQTLISRFGRSSALVREAQSALATAYEKLGQPEQAAERRKELERMAARTPQAASDAVTLRLPNLLLSAGKRSRWSASNPITQPAEPVVTPPVNNIDGTATLPPLPVRPRSIEFELAPPPRPLAFDVAPYVQSPDASDDKDGPAEP